jgi:hypothetical protein
LTNTSRGGGTYQLVVGRIVLKIEGHADILFLDDLRGPEGEALARQLANDLGRPVTRIDREDW